MQLILIHNCIILIYLFNIAVGLSIILFSVRAGMAKKKFLETAIKVPLDHTVVANKRHYVRSNLSVYKLFKIIVLLKYSKVSMMYNDVLLYTITTLIYRQLQAQARTVTETQLKVHSIITV